MDLDAYFTRIGYRGATRAATLDLLRALSDAHVRSVPFENIDVLLGRTIELEPDALFAKLVTAKRGGYCFEQNGLFLEVLREIGFDATPLSARVRLQRPRDFTPPRTHVFIRVRIDGAEWLADVGVGAASLTSPLRFTIDGQEQPTNHEPRRLIEEDGRKFHQIKYGDNWADVYEFTGEEMPMIDRTVANWFTSAHPKSHFKDRFMVARALPNGRRATILNREFTIRAADGSPTTRPIESPSALQELLTEHFGLIGFSADEAKSLLSAAP
jgi:N-hydroxyarylamine O-acetyltransferase